MRTFVAAAVLSLMLASVANSQEEEEDPRELETITVTGSRLERIDYETPVPVVVFTREELLASGYGTLADFTNKLVYMYGPSDGFIAELTEVIKLRDIGGTLILVNGRRLARFPNADFRGTPFQEISTIPIWAIERVEILKDGASALYGSDAITGVVNIILRKGYQGIETSFRYETPSRGRSGEKQFSATAGYGTGRFNGMVSVTAFERDEGRRGELAVQSELYARLGIREPFISNSGFPGTYIDPETFEVFPDPECPPELLELGQSRDFLGQPTCAIRNGDFFSTDRPSDRYGIHALGDYRFETGLLFEAELFLSERESQFTFPLFPVLVFDNGSVFARPIVPADHPFNPFGRTVEALISPRDGPLFMLDQRSELARYRVGLSGQAGEIDWASSLSFEKNKLEDRTLNGVDSTRFQAALRGEGGPTGDQLYNPFGLNPDNPPELLEWLISDGDPALGESSLALMDFFVRGDLAEWDAGPVQYVAGLEYQGMEIQNNSIDEDRDILAAFVEFGLPVSDAIEAQLAARTEHYSDFGSTTNPKLAVLWRPLDQWLFRASWSTSFRAPSLENLFRKPPPNSFRVFIEDPIRCPVTGDIQDCGQAASIELIRRGNPDLEPEDGESIHISAMWQPSDRLSAELSFWEFDYTDQVVNVPRFILLQFADDPNFFIREEPTPSDIALGLPGRLIALVDQPLNGDDITTRGIDLEVRYDLPLGSHELDFRWVSSFQEEQQRIRLGFEEFGPLEDAGTFKPDVQSRLDITWQRGDHQLTGTLYYQSDFIYNAFELDGGDTVPIEVDSFTVFDLQYRFNWPDWNTEFRIGCKNCLDSTPPFSPDGGLDYNHDGRGTILYAQVDWRFGR